MRSVLILCKINFHITTINIKIIDFTNKLYSLIILFLIKYVYMVGKIVNPK